MFTGIVRGLEPVVEIIKQADNWRLRVALEGALAERLDKGNSIAINGTCLTVVDFTASGSQVIVDFDVMLESLNKTTLGSLKVGDRVNVERAMRYGDEVGGHQVTGHVDTTGTIDQIDSSPNHYEVFVRVPHPENFGRFLFPKGWIAIDGTSLTVVKVEGDRFSVCLIPETLARTTLGNRKVGDKVNLEFDSHAKVTVLTLERVLPKMVADYVTATGLAK
eukprot:Colp12_sorted_trinity150504_noHs@26258